MSSTCEPRNGARIRHCDPRIPDPPPDLLTALGPAQAALAAAYWRIGYAACLDTPRTPLRIPATREG